MIYLHKGDRNDIGTIQIVDEDRLCFLVLSTNKSSRGLRTISKQLLEEFVQWESQNPDGKATDARDELSGKSEIDKFEYGYNATLYALAKLNREIADGRPLNVKPLESPAQLQQIFYGAPGTGKSHSVKTETEAWEERGRVVRTTFHPDSDYSTFVGAYKPTTESVQRYDIYNKPMTRDGVPVMEQIITYEFVGQAFLHAYIDAWKNREEPEFLIIEEINRGNCAQIFGDLFQLLDRGDDGYSEYAIKADKDLQKHLSKAFKDVEIEDFPNVKAGKELLLPNNLYIRATMNTSDQSLFPIDSAFKRRWDWKYRPISNAQLGWKIEADGMLYDWWEFLERINREIGTTTNSEDKKLGYFFCKAKEGRISAETFVGKVVFYLWNDVFKDYELSNSFFDDGEGGKLTFDKFYFVEDNETRIAEESISLFLSNLGVEEEENEEPEDAPDDTTPLTTFFVYNGEEVRSKKFITCMEELVKRIGPAEVRKVVGKSLVITKEEIDVLSGKPDRERALSHPLGDNLFLRANKSNADHRKLIQKVKDALDLTSRLSTAEPVARREAQPHLLLPQI